MSLETESQVKQYAGNGVTTAFSYPYKFFEDGDLKVILTSSAGVETPQTITTNYTVSGAGEDAGGTVTMVTAPASGETLTIYRDPAKTQGLDLRENDSAPAEEIEKALDRNTMLIQRLSELVDRKIGLTDGFVDSFTLTLPSDLATANKALVVNSSGNGWDMGPTTDEISNAQTYANNAASSATASASSASDSANSASAAANSATAAQNAAASVIWNDVVFLTNADSPYTVSESDRGKMLDVDCSSGAVTINLPSIAALDLDAPYVVGIKKSDSSGNGITVNRNGTDTINGDTSKSIAVAQSGATFIPDTDPTPDEWTTADFGSSAGNITVDNFNGDGSTTGFTLSVDPGSENNTRVYIEGVYQQKNTYSVSGTTLTFTTAPPTGTNNIEVEIGTTLSVGTPSDGTVSRAKLASGAVAPRNNSAKTSNYTVTTSDDIILCDTSGGAFTLTMPTEASASGREFLIKKTSSDFTALTINDDAASEITQIHTEGETVRIFTDGTSWYIIDRYIPSEWASYTPTITNFGTVSGVSFHWKRIGGSAFFRGSFSSGTSVASEAQIGILSGTTIGGSGLKVVGDAVKNAATSNQWVLLATAGDAYLNVGEENTAGASTPANANGLTSSGQVLYVTSGPIPISGWNG